MWDHRRRGIFPSDPRVSSIPNSQSHQPSGVRPRPTRTPSPHATRASPRHPAVATPPPPSSSGRLRLLLLHSRRRRRRRASRTRGVARSASPTRWRVDLPGCRRPVARRAVRAAYPRPRRATPPRCRPSSQPAPLPSVEPPGSRHRHALSSSRSGGHMSMPAGKGCPRIAGAGRGCRPWRAAGAGTGTEFWSRVRARDTGIRGHSTRCHLDSPHVNDCHVDPAALQLLVKEGKFLARSASGQLALVESDGPRRRSARNNGDAESRRGRPPPPSPRGGGADLRPALHRPAR